MIRTVLLLVASLPCLAQNFYGAAVNFLPQSSPKPTGMVFYAKQASVSSGLWSDSELLFTVGKGGTIQTTPSTGAELFLRTIVGWDLYARGTLGATTNGTNVGLSAVWGTFALRSVGRGFYAGVGWTELATNAASGSKFASVIVGHK